MLCIAKVRAAGHAYYLEVVDSGAEAPGEWLNTARSSLGLSGAVRGPDLEAVLAGADPSGTGTLGGSRNRVKVAGFDMTFCAPKSVSLLFALGEDDVAQQVKEGHRQAVGRAVSYVERRVLAVRRGSGKHRAPVEAHGVPIAGFVHRVSRALDPHLHTHVVVANLAMASDGSWSALDGRGVYAHRSAVGAVYHAQLRHELSARLGVDWGPLDRGRGDIAGIGPDVRRGFSRRALQIEAHLEGRGLTGHSSSLGSGPFGSGRHRPAERRGPSTRARTVAAFATRAPRDPALDPEGLRPAWRTRAVEMGLSPRRLESVLGRVRSVELDQYPGRGDVESRVAVSLSELGHGVARRDVVRTWCSLLDRGAESESIERAADDFVSRLDPVPGSTSMDRPGVGERRYIVSDRHLEHCSQPRAELSSQRALERRRVERILEELGMSRAAGRGLEHERGAVLERASGLDLSW